MISERITDIQSFFRRHWFLGISLVCFVILLLCAHSFTGNKPIICKYKGEWHWMGMHEKPKNGSILLRDLSSQAGWNWYNLEYEKVWWPLLPYSPNTLNIESQWLPPGSTLVSGEFSPLGTFDLGRDVFSGIIYGIQKALWIGLISMSIALTFGMILGSYLSYAGRTRKSMSWISFLACVLAIGICFFLIGMIVQLKGNLPIGVVVFLILSLIACLYGAIRWREYGTQIPFDTDILLLRYLEFMKSIPTMMFILLCIQILAQPGMWNLAIIIGFMYIPVVAKYSRWNTLQQTEEGYVSAAKSMGQKSIHIIHAQIWPKLFFDLIPVISFGIGNTILMESALSFLGLGLPIEEVSLGSMMQSVRAFPQAWWVVLFPGLAVFWLVWIFNRFGEVLSRFDALKEQSIP